MTFKDAVEAAQNPVNGTYRQGKQAMERKHRRLVTCEEPARLTGSIDLDARSGNKNPTIIAGITVLAISRKTEASMRSGPKSIRRRRKKSRQFSENDNG